MHDPHERAPSSVSDETVELPQRFDEYGNKRSGHGGSDDLASRLGFLLSHSIADTRRSGGAGGFGDVLRHLASEALRGTQDRDGRGGVWSR